MTKKHSPKNDVAPEGMLAQRSHRGLAMSGTTLFIGLEINCQFFKNSWCLAKI
jgi:hypothetical protein